MLARIKFTHDKNNRLSKQGLEELENYLGESVKSSQMKMGDNGEPETLSYLDTFDKEKVGKDPDYKLVEPIDMYMISDSNNYIVDLENFAAKYPKLEFTIKGVPKSVGQNNEDLIAEMNKISRKIEEAKNRFDKVVEFNQRCDVHVPNLGLLNINKLAYATDYCTEQLQSLLFQGWRIIAVCPQPDQRRPDYILGMSVTELHDNVDVEHFYGEGREKGLREIDENKAKNFSLSR